MRSQILHSLPPLSSPWRRPSLLIPLRAAGAIFSHIRGHGTHRSKAWSGLSSQIRLCWSIHRAYTTSALVKWRNCVIFVAHGPVRCLSVSRSRTHRRNVHRLPRRWYPASCVPAFLSSATGSTSQQRSGVLSCVKELGNRLRICMHLADRCCCLVLGMRYLIWLVCVRPGSSMRLLASRQPLFQSIGMKRPMHWCRIGHMVLLKRGITLITFCGCIALIFCCSNQLRKCF